MKDWWQVVKAWWYCIKQGYRITLRQLDEKPEHWGYTINGWARCPKRNNAPFWVEVAWVKGHHPNDIAATIWHEVGHIEHFKLAREETNHRNPWLLWEEEADAWERGLALAGERGYTPHPATCYAALASLFTYLPVPDLPFESYPPITFYLKERTLNASL